MTKGQANYVLVAISMITVVLHSEPGKALMKVEHLHGNYKLEADNELTSTAVRERVIAARAKQYQRQGHSNAQLVGKALEKMCPLTTSQQTILARAMEKLGLSARAYHRTLRVARSLADVDGENIIQDHHVMEALSYRNLDRAVGAAEIA